MAYTIKQWLCTIQCNHDLFIYKIHWHFSLNVCNCGLEHNKLPSDVAVETSGALHKELLGSLLQVPPN